MNYISLIYLFFSLLAIGQGHNIYYSLAEAFKKTEPVHELNLTARMFGGTELIKALPKAIGALLNLKT